MVETKDVASDAAPPQLTEHRLDASRTEAGRVRIPMQETYAEVSKFLAARPRLRDLVDETLTKIASHFPDGAHVSLEFAKFSEPGSRPELTLRIHADLPIAEAFARLDRLDEAWWLDALPRAQGELNITVGPT